MSLRKPDAERNISGIAKPRDASSTISADVPSNRAVTFDQNKLDQSLKAYQLLRDFLDAWAFSEEARLRLTHLKTLLEAEIAAMKSRQSEAD